MTSKETENLSLPTTGGEETIRKRRRPLWGLAALILIVLITLSILYMANVQIRKDQRKDQEADGQHQRDGDQHPCKKTSKHFRYSTCILCNIMILL